MSAVVKEWEIGDVLGELSAAKSIFLPGVAAQPNGFFDAVARSGMSFPACKAVVGFVSGINEFERLSGLSGPVVSFFPVIGEALDSVHIRTSYFGADGFLRDNPPEAIILEVGPPDRAGLCALGTAADYSETVFENAKLRIAAINPSLPRLRNAPTVPFEDFQIATRVSSAQLTLAPQASDAVSCSIATKVASLIGDGATLQLGIGKIPAQVLGKLRAHRDLRFHSGIIASEIRQLAEDGALAAERAVMAASYIGEADFYDWLAERDDFAVRPVRYTHAPKTLAKVERLVAINSAIEVDLSGAINAEWAGGLRISAPGGLPDFASAAQANEDGLSLVALPATATGGSRSRIVPRLWREPTVEGTHIDIVVTEYGIADLRGRSVASKAKALASIAAPEFRTDLTASIDKLT